MAPRPILALWFFVDILTFELDSRRYAFPAEQVVQVVQMVAISPLPGAPAVVEGVVNVRGTVIPILDLRARLGLPSRPVDPAENLVILNAGGRNAGVRVDSADDYLTVGEGGISGMSDLSDAGGGASGTKHVAGIAATDDGTIVIYDLARFLTSQESGTLDAALAPADA